MVYNKLNLIYSTSIKFEIYRYIYSDLNISVNNKTFRTSCDKNHKKIQVYFCIFILL